MPRPTAALCLLLAATSPAPANDVYTWIGGSGPVWFEADNWELDGRSVEDPPGCNAAVGVDAFIAAGPSMEVDVLCPAGGTLVSVGELTALSPLVLKSTLRLGGTSLLSNLEWSLNGGLEANAPVELVGDDIRWNRGPIGGSDRVTLVGTMSADPSFTRQLTTELDVRGWFAHDGNTNLAEANGGLPSRLSVGSGGVLSGRGLVSRSTSDLRMTNFGTTGATNGSLTLRVPVWHFSGGYGAIDGTLRFSQGFRGLGDAAIEPVTGGLVVMQATPGADPYELLSGTTTVRQDGDVILVTDLHVGPDATLRADSSLDAAMGLELRNTIDLEGTFEVPGLLSLRSARIENLGSMTVGPAGRVETVAQTTRELAMGTLDVQGVFVHRGTTRFLLPLDPVISGSLEVRDGILDGDTELRITGLLIRPVDATSDSPQLRSPWALESGGELVNETGLFRIQDDGRLAGGTIRAEADATIDIGARIVADPATGLGGTERRFTGGGLIEFGSSGVLELPTDTEVIAQMTGDDGVLRFVGADIEGESGELRNLGWLELFGGRLDAGARDLFGVFGGVLNQNGGTTLVGSNLRIAGGLVNDGGDLSVESAVTLEDPGTIEARSGTIDIVDGNISDGGAEGLGEVWVRAGATLRKSADATIPTEVRTTLRLDDGATLEQAGPTLEVDGELRLDGTATVEIAADRELVLAGGGTGAGADSGQGTLDASGTPGTLAFAGFNTVWSAMDVRSGLSTELRDGTFRGQTRLIAGEGAFLEWQRGTIESDAAIDVQAGGVLVTATPAGRTAEGAITVEAGGAMWHEAGSVALNTGSLSIQPNGRLELRGGSSISSADIPAAGILSAGTVAKDGATTNTISARFNGVGSTVDVRDGTLRFTGDVVDVSNGFLSPDDLGVANRWTVGPGGRVEITEPISAVGPGAEVFCDPPIQDGFPTLADIELNQGTLFVNGTFTMPLVNLGVLSPRGGDIIFPGGIINGRDPGADLIGDLEGVVELADAPSGRAPRIIVTSLVNEGRIIPGGSGAFGTVAITGDLLQQPEGEFAMELDGTSADAVTVDGAVTLDGTLRIDVLGPAELPLGTELVVLTATGPINGGFDEVIAAGGWELTAVDGVVTATLVTPPSCPEDLDGDAAVGLGDLLAVLATWGVCVDCPEDLDGDEIVGLGDLLLVLAAWGPCHG